VSWQPIDAPKEDIAAAARNFRKKARFLVDESLGLETAKFLRELGWNVKDVSEVGLLGRSDEDVLAYAFRQKRILLTHDTDFLDDRQFPPHRNPGVVVLPGGSGQQEPLIHALFDLLSIVGPFAEVYQDAKMQISTDRVFSARHRYADGTMKTSRYRIGGNGPALEWVEEPQRLNKKQSGKAQASQRNRVSKTQR
jgi:predicted nuclease of predicted toxin-antitoxin system